jgi:hypothetical protein
MVINSTRIHLKRMRKGHVVKGISKYGATVGANVHEDGENRPIVIQQKIYLLKNVHFVRDPTV